MAKDVRVIGTAQWPACSSLLTYSDISRTQLFQVIISTYNTNRQVNWQRNAAMLVVNAFILPVLGTQVLSKMGGRLVLKYWKRNFHDVFVDPQGLLLILICIFGVLVCIIWLVLQLLSYSEQKYILREANRFEWAGNFSSPLQRVVTGKSDRVRRWFIVLLIFLFGFSYVVLADLLCHLRWRLS